METTEEARAQRARVPQMPPGATVLELLRRALQSSNVEADKPREAVENDRTADIQAEDFAKVCAGWSPQQAAAVIDLAQQQSSRTTLRMVGAPLSATGTSRERQGEQTSRRERACLLLFYPDI